ncbi:MAG: hypothetical protein WDN45_18045 [Caulobacteraceae bacterium]
MPAGEAVLAALSARVRDGVEAGELDAGLDGDAVGRMLLVVRSGLKVAARGGASESELRADRPSGAARPDPRSDLAVNRR